jgi:predicted ribonuclease YlaK
MVIDSLIKNTITAISGKAGSGKSLLSLLAAMHLIETGKYSRLVVMFNPTKTRGASDLGFYSGSFIEKAMQNSIGQILTTKFGDRLAVDMLIQQEKIKLVSMADARGIEIRDDEILYITECQNTSIDLLKLCLSRASSGCKIIIEGDYTSQVDSFLFNGDNNGMRRAIDILKGNDIFGYVELQNVWRSRIAELVEKM